MSNKRRYALVVNLMLIIASGLVFAGGDPEGDTVTLTFGSWRADDVAQMNQLFAAFSEQYPNIQVEYQPTNPPDYNATLRLQLENGTGPDLLYARSYATGVDLFESGYLSDISELAVLSENYDEAARAPWTTAGGASFAMPFVAVSHGIYYNKDIFEKLGIGIPANWPAFLEACQKIADAGYIPIANGLADEWDIAEVVFMSLAPNHIGGRAGRLAYENGDRPFNDADMVSAFTAMQSLAPYLPEGFEAIGYNDSNALFATEKAAMYFDGSWSIGTYGDVAFSWGVMAVPTIPGKSSHITFHPDAGVAINAATEHPEEAAILLSWLGSAEAAEIVANKLPTGFFPLLKTSVSINDPHANEFLALNKTVDSTDVRLPWPVLMSGDPSGYQLIVNGSIEVIKGSKTPQQAADTLQEGLASWYTP